MANKKIKAVTMQFDAKHNGCVSVLDATAGFVNCRQQQGQTPDSYLTALKTHADTIEYHSAAKRAQIARDCTLGVAYIHCAVLIRRGTVRSLRTYQTSSAREKMNTRRT